MKKSITCLIATAVIATFSAHPISLAHAERIAFKPKVEVTGAQQVNCGVIKPTEPVGAQEEKATNSRFVHIMDELETPEFLPGCPNFLAKVGTQFGIQVQIDGSPSLETVNLVTRVTHPPMRNPATGEVTTTEQWPSPMNIGYARFAGWRFDEEWELIAGEWTIEILRGEKVLIKQIFNVAVSQ